MTTVAGLEASLSLETAAFESGTERARRAMQQTMGNIQRDVTQASNSLSLLTTGLGSLARGLAGGLIAGAGITSLTNIVGMAVREFSEAENAQIKFAAVLRATDQAAGISAEALREFASQMEQTRVVTAATVTEAASRLATFEGITGSTFTRAIELAQDLSVVLGEDLVSSTVRVGRALQDPAEGLAMLSRAGIKFSGDQQAIIDQFLEMGRVAEAQGVILDELAQRVGGTGTAQAGSLTGAFDGATKAAGNFVSSLFGISGGADVTVNALGAITDAFQEAQRQLETSGIPGLLFGLAGGYKPPTTRDEQQIALKRELIEAEKELVKIQEDAAGRTAPRFAEALKAQQEIVDNLRDSIKKIDAEISHAGVKAGSYFAEIAQPIEPPKVDTGLQARLGEIWKGMNDAAKDAANEAERAGKAAAKEAEQRAKSLTLLQQQAEDAVKLADAVGKGAYAEELIRIELEKQNKLRAAALEYSGEQLRLATQAIEKEYAARRREAAIETPVPTIARGEAQSAAVRERESMEQLAKDQFQIDQDALKRREREAKAFAKAQAEILLEPWKDLASDINSIMSDVFEQILFDAGSMDFSTIADGIGDTFARAISGSLANIIMKPVTDVFSKLATEGVASITAALKAGGLSGGVMAAGLGGAGGFAIGSAYSQIAGLKPGNQAALGGAIGGAAGAVIGNMILPGIGTAIGAALGGTGGGFLGGLFGGQNNLGNDRSGQIFNLRRGLTYSDRSFSQENRQITQGIIDELSTLKEALEGIGAEFERFNLQIEAGNKTGITVNGKRYASAQDALRGSIEVMLGGTKGLTGIQSQILKTTKAGTAQGVLADVQFGKTYEDLINKGTELDRALAALNQTFGQAGRKAAELGLDVNALAEAHQREAAAVVQEFQARQESFRAQLQTIAPASGGETITAQFSALNQQFAELGRAAQQLGIPIEEVAAAHQRATANLTTSIQQQQRNLVLQLRSTGIGGADVIRAQFEQLNAQFQELGRSAMALSIPLEEVTAAHQRAAAQLSTNISQQQRQTAEAVALAAGDQSFATQMHMLTTQMRELLQRMVDAGFDFNQAYNTVVAAHGRAIKNLEFSYNQMQRGIYERIAQAKGDTSLATQLHILETQMRELAHQAANASVPLSLVTQAHQAAAARITEAHNELRQSFRTEVAAVSPVGSTLTVALAELDQRMNALRKRAIELGESISQVDAAQARARAELIARQQKEAAAFLREIETMSPTGNLLARQLAEINDRFFDLRERAKDLGVAITVLDAAQVRARDQARLEYELQRSALQRELGNIAPTGDQLALILREVDDRFIDLRTRAIELDVALSQVDAAHARARDEAIRQFNERRAELLIQVQNLGATGLTAILNDIREQFRDLRKELDAVGLATVDLTLKQREAEQRAVAEAERQVGALEQQAAEQQRGIRDFFESLMAPLRAANQNVLAPIAQIETARRRFAETAALAREGDLEALRDLAGVTQELMGLRERFLSSGGLGAEILAQIQAGTQGIVAGLEQQQREAMASVPDVIRETTSEHIRVMIAENAKTLEELQALRREIAQNRLKAA